MSNTTVPTVYVWAADSPDTVPDRLPVTTCQACHGLVPAAELDAHSKWHRNLGDDLPGGAR